EDAQQRGFSRPVRADDPQDGAGRHVERDAPQGPELLGRRTPLDEAHHPGVNGRRRAVTADAEPQAEVADADRRCGHSSFPKCGPRRVKYQPPNTTAITPSAAVYAIVQSGGRCGRIAPR